MLKLTLALCLITAALIGWASLRLGGPSRTTTDDLVITQRLRAAADLVTLEIEGTQLVESHVTGYLGATRCLLVARTTTKVGTDLSKAEVRMNEGSVATPTPGRGAGFPHRQPIDTSRSGMSISVAMADSAWWRAAARSSSVTAARARVSAIRRAS